MTKFVKKIIAKVVLINVERFGVLKLRTRRSVIIPRMPQYHMMTWHFMGIFCFLPRFKKNDSTKVLHARATKHMTSVIIINHKFQFSAPKFSGVNKRIPKDTNTINSDKKSKPLLFKKWSRDVKDVKKKKKKKKKKKQTRQAGKENDGILQKWNTSNSDSSPLHKRITKWHQKSQSTQQGRMTCKPWWESALTGK